MEEILNIVGQRDVVLLLIGLLLARPANAVSAWVWATVAAQSARGATPAPLSELNEDSGSWICDFLGMAILVVAIGIPVIAITPLLVVAAGGFVYVCWHLAWLALVAIWGAVSTSEATPRFARSLPQPAGDRVARSPSPTS